MFVSRKQKSDKQALDTVALSQGWKFALWFFEQMARFLRAKERMASELVMSLFFKER